MVRLPHESTYAFCNLTLRDETYVTTQYQLLWKLLAINLKSLNNNASALNEARGQSAGVRCVLKNV
jgi:hypothetical protein